MKITLANETMTIEKLTYGDKSGRLAVQVMCEDGPFLTLSVNIPEVELEEGEFIVKNYSENEPYIKPIFDSGLFIDTGKRVSGGYVVMPVWKFK